MKEKITVKIKNNNKFLHLDFYANCGEFGTTEALDSFKITAKELINILQDYEEYNDITLSPDRDD